MAHIGPTTNATRTILVPPLLLEARIWTLNIVCGDTTSLNWKRLEWLKIQEVVLLIHFLGKMILCFRKFNSCTPWRYHFRLPLLWTTFNFHLTVTKWNLRKIYFCKKQLRRYLLLVTCTNYSITVLMCIPLLATFIFIIFIDFFTHENWLVVLCHTIIVCKLAS